MKTTIGLATLGGALAASKTGRVGKAATKSCLKTEHVPAFLTYSVDYDQYSVFRLG